MTNVTKEILNFSLFLDRSWDTLRLFISKDNNAFSEGDWLQANWEILLESKICKPGFFLQHYSEGADCYGEYSRVTYYDKAATHKIIGKLSLLKSYDYNSHTDIFDLKEYTFLNFLNIDNGIEDITAPFDYVEFEHDIIEKKIWLKKNEVQYYLVPLLPP